MKNNGKNKHFVLTLSNGKIISVDKKRQESWDALLCNSDLKKSIELLSLE